MSESTSTTSADPRWSDLADGELDPQGVDALCAAWRNDAQARAQWHAYQLIGDVLRSDELAFEPGHDAAFVAKLRDKLAAEPVVLAPEVTASAPGHRARARRWSWMASSAVAAGFMAVGGALVVFRAPVGTVQQPGQELARAPAPEVATVVATAGGASAADVPLVASASRPDAGTPLPSGRLVRDPGLDRYLAAHQQFASTSAFGASSGFLRNAAAEVPAR